MIDLRQTEKYASYMRNLGWKVERIQNINYFIRPFFIFGSFMKVQRPQKIDIKIIVQLQKKHRVFNIIIEPKHEKDILHITGYGLRSSSPYLPSKTIHIDLTKSETQLLKEMRHKTRYNIKQAQKKGVEVKVSKDIKLFSDMWKHAKFSRRIMGTKDITELYKAFGKDAYLLLAYKESELLAGVVCIHANNIAYYMYAATTEQGKKLYAPTLLAWEQIKLAKRKGNKVFDFEGVYDERFPLNDWKGFSRFKKSFGGKEVEYPGAFSKVKLF